MILLVLVSFAIPWRSGRNLQTFPASRGFASFEEFARFPSCLVRAAQYLREHSHSGDVIQDSENDRNLLFGALAERPEFAVDWMFGEKSTALTRILRMTQRFSAS
jgi:hypothetical protein